MPYEVVSPKSIFADFTPAKSVDQVTIPTVAIRVLSD